MKTIYLLTIFVICGICSAQLRPPAPSGGGSPTPGTETQFAGTVINNPLIGSAAWTSPSNATTENGVSANCNLAAFPSENTQLLESSNYGFNIAVGSTIDGILAEWKASTTTLDGADGSNIVQACSKGGAYDKIPAAFNGDGLTASLVYYSAGDVNDLWGTTWAVSDINASTFGFYVQMQDAGDVAGNLYDVDAMKITVYYTTAGGGSGTRTLALGKPTNGLRVQ